MVWEFLLFFIINVAFTICINLELRLFQLSHVNQFPAQTTWPAAQWRRQRRAPDRAGAVVAAVRRRYRPRRPPPRPVTTARTTCAASRRPRTTSPDLRVLALYQPGRGLEREYLVCHRCVTKIIGPNSCVKFGFVFGWLCEAPKHESMDVGTEGEPHYQ